MAAEACIEASVPAKEKRWRGQAGWRRKEELADCGQIQGTYGSIHPCSLVELSFFSLMLSFLASSKSITHTNE
jgi:hypothetical protein